MRREAALIVGIVLAWVFGGTGPSKGANVTGPDLTAPAACGSGESFAPSVMLRRGPTGAIDDKVFQTMRDRLSTGPADRKALCEIDAAVIQSQSDKSLFEHVGNVSLVAELLRLLADNWNRLGELHRADWLYQNAYDLEEKSPEMLVLGRIATLQGWASLKIKLGELQRAKWLANRQSELARTDYHLTGSSPGLLASALKFQATILEKIGSIAEARAAWEEAGKLSGVPYPCEGMCGYRCEGDLCGRGGRK